jgi:hypothetical protein
MPYSDYEPLLAYASEISKTTPVSQSVAAHYRGRLPDGLLEFWLRHGNEFAFGDGYSQMCDPETFSPVIKNWFEGDQEFHHSNLIVYGYSSFGSLFVCDGTNNLGTIHSSQSNFQYAPFKSGSNVDRDLDYFIASTLKLGTVKPRFIDKNDLHNRAVAKHGPLAQGEMFTWVPPLQLAKSGNRIEKVDAEVQISILQELGPLKYIADKFTDDGIYMGTEFKRFIGPQR